MTFSYESQAKLHEDLVALYPRFRDEARFRRNMDISTVRGTFRDLHSEIPVVDRDLVVAALVSKAARTKKAIKVLCDQALADDAMALARVILETAVILEWLLAEEHGVRRLDTYCLAKAAIRKKMKKVVADHYADRPELVASANEAVGALDAAIAAELFTDSYVTWAWFPDPANPARIRKVTLKEMFRDLGEDGTPGFVYDMVYFDGSEIIHSGPSSLTRIGRVLQKTPYFEIDDSGDSTRAATALLISNLSMSAAMRHMASYMGCDKLRSEIQELVAPLLSADSGTEVEE